MALVDPAAAFRLFDETGAGVLGVYEFALFVELLGLELSNERLRALFESFGTRGAITYDDFTRVWSRLASAKEVLGKAGAKAARWANPWLLTRKLEFLIDSEDKDEKQALLDEEKYREWVVRMLVVSRRCLGRAPLPPDGADPQSCTNALSHACTSAQLQTRDKAEAAAAVLDVGNRELSLAIDAAGAVFTFGPGPGGCMQRDVAPPRALDFPLIMTLWERRVHAPGTIYADGGKAGAQQPRA